MPIISILTKIEYRTTNIEFLNVRKRPNRPIFPLPDQKVKAR